MNDPIVDEIRRIREAHAARFDYDLDAIFQDIKEQEKKSGHNFIVGVDTTRSCYTTRRGNLRHNLLLRRDFRPYFYCVG